MQPPLNHFTSPKYWVFYHKLPHRVREVADDHFNLLKNNPKHPSLHFKKIRDLWSVRAGIHYRALGIETEGSPKGILWIWIGSHAEYDQLVKRS